VRVHVCYCWAEHSPPSISRTLHPCCLKRPRKQAHTHKYASTRTHTRTRTPTRLRIRTNTHTHTHARTHRPQRVTKNHVTMKCYGLGLGLDTFRMVALDANFRKMEESQVAATYSRCACARVFSTVCRLLCCCLHRSLWTCRGWVVCVGEGGGAAESALL